MKIKTFKNLFYTMRTKHVALLVLTMTVLLYGDLPEVSGSLSGVSMQGCAVMNFPVNPSGLEWDRHTDETVVGYNIYEAQMLGGQTIGESWQCVVQPESGDPSYSLEGHANGIYYWKVTAYTDQETVKQSETGTSDGHLTLGASADTQYYATKFEAASDYSLVTITAYLERVGTPGFNIRFCLYWHDSTEDDPNYVLSCSEYVDDDTLNASETAVEFDLTTAHWLGSGTTYWVVAECSATNDGSNYVKWHTADSTVDAVCYDADGEGEWSDDAEASGGKYALHYEPKESGFSNEVWAMFQSE